MRFLWSWQISLFARRWFHWKNPKPITTHLEFSESCVLCLWFLFPYIEWCTHRSFLLFLLLPRESYDLRVSDGLWWWRRRNMTITFMNLMGFCINLSRLISIIIFLAPKITNLPLSPIPPPLPQSRIKIKPTTTSHILFLFVLPVVTQN